MPLHEAILSEQTVIHATRVSADTNESIYLDSFYGAEEFCGKLREAISALASKPLEDAKLLVLAAHGQEQTGTLLKCGNGELIHLWETHIDPARLPPNLAILIQACYGGYPSAQAFQYKAATRPIIVGPLVDVEVRHAKSFLEHLKRNLAKFGATDSAVQNTVDVFNHPSKYRSSYSGRYFAGMYRKDGSFHPDVAIGSQLAADVRKGGIFTITRLVPNGEGRQAIECMLVNSAGQQFTASIGPLVEGLQGTLPTIGISFEADFQVIGGFPLSNSKIVLLKPRLRRNEA